MNDLRQAAQQALEALESGDWYIDQLEMLVYSADDTGTHEERAKVQAAITALRAALGEPEQEPVAWEQFHPDIGKPQTTHWEGCEAVHPECRKTKQEPVGISWLKRDSGYFTAPTPRKPLTDQEIDALDSLPFYPSDADVIAFARRIEQAHGIK